MIYECPNGHINDGIKIDDFPKTQDINISLIICDQCKNKNMGNTYNKDFYRCLTCKKNICVLCKSSHDPNHNIIEYEQKIMYVQNIMNYIQNIVNNVIIIYVIFVKKNIKIII